MENPLHLKVGDKVRLDLYANPDLRRMFREQDIAEVAVIDPADPILTYQLKACDGDTWWVCNKHIIGKVEDGDAEKPTKKFRIGDKVRVIGHRPSNANEGPVWVGQMDDYAGNAGEVIYATGSIIGVRFDDGDCWRYIPEWLEPVEPESEAPRFSMPLRSMGEAAAQLTTDFMEAFFGAPKPQRERLPLIETDKLLTINLE